jgi:hypothetical protein
VRRRARDEEVLVTAPVKPTITIDVLDQVDIRVGTIAGVDDVEEIGRAHV